MGPVIEVVAVELIDAHADRTRRDERVENEFLFVEEADDVRDRLVREVAPDHSFVLDGVISLADPGEHQQLHIEDGVCRKDDELRGLLPLLTARIHERDACGSVA
jgi:hypothetical protein